MMKESEKQYHMEFTKTDAIKYNPLGEIPARVISEVRATIQNGLFRLETQEEKLNLLTQLKNQLVQLYNIDNCGLRIVPNYPGVGGYSPFRKEIIINKCSLVTFLHEFRHHIQFCLRLDCDKEEDARGWSHACYFLATPRLFETAVRKGIIIFQKTFTTDSLLTPEQIANIKDVHFIRRNPSPNKPTREDVPQGEMI